MKLKEAICLIRLQGCNLAVIPVCGGVCVLTLQPVLLWRSLCFLPPQVTRGMFGANRKKFMEGGVESDYADESSLYYSQQSMFPTHRTDKDVSPSAVLCCGLKGSDFMLILHVLISHTESNKAVHCFCCSRQWFQIKTTD